MTATLSPHHALAVIENCLLPLLFTDKQGGVVGYNRAFEHLVGQDHARLLNGRGFPDLEDHPARPLLGPERLVCWTDRDARPRHFQIHDMDLPGTDFVQARLFVEITRQIELERAHATLSEELRQHILTDRLTGLLNRRGVLLALAPQVARSRRYNSPIAVVMMDVQCQSDSNSTHLEVARALKDQMRWADLVGYTQQREFMLVLQETTAEAALNVADKLKHHLQDLADRELGGRSLSTCYGVAGWRRSDTAETLLSRAGQALSQARSGHHAHSVAP